MKQLAAKLRGRGKVCFSYLCNSQIFKKEAFEELTGEEDFISWEVEEGCVLKNGERYESEQTKTFFMNYAPKQLLK